ncbi:MAG: hypothetical protein IJ321_07635 [Alistipes sp.]|uniref:hypothetical protein n=1 Tax=Alistipes sp. TaxID=1872444 RepID=UPI0023EF5D6D|nr:hypothetical protein [Alistipes sp.]MBQ7893796.1 hypothetical protein [Alistipes sp.]
MKRNKDWTDVMRNALRDAELPPPAGGWERLERELGGAAPGLGASETAAPRGSVWRIYWPRIAAAAAVVLLGVVAGDYMLRPDKVLENDGNVIASAVGEEATAVTMPQPREAESVQETLARVAGLADGRTAAPAVQRPELLAAAVKPAAKTMAAETIAETTTAESSQPAAEPAANTVGERPATRSKTGVSARTAYYDEPLTAYKPPRRKTSLSAFAAGGVSGASGGNGAAPWMYSSVTNDVSSIVGNGDNLSLMVRNDYNENSFRHHQPLSFGLTVRKEFAHGLSLESGVNYTLLRSDVTVKYSSEDVSQKLHFIGIPLRMNWQFLERGRFSLYIGAGGMAEKCVSAKFGSESVDEPGVQWSALAAVGAQYRLGGLVGLYFEPEGSYYFTETRLKTARTDSPLTLTLRLGVRLSF